MSENHSNSSKTFEAFEAVLRKNKSVEESLEREDGDSQHQKEAGNEKEAVSGPTKDCIINAMEIKQNKNELHLYPINDNEYIGAIEVDASNMSNNTQTVVILDVSGSMGPSVARFVNEILPSFMSKMNYSPSYPIHLISFSSKTIYVTLSRTQLMKSDLKSGGGTVISPAIEKLCTVLERMQRDDPGTPVRVLTVSDGVISDRANAEKETKKLTDLLATSDLTINSQAIRMFTSENQPDTKALSYLLQINNSTASNLCDIQATESNENIANAIAALFRSDGFQQNQILKFEKSIVLKFPWNSCPSTQIIIVPGWNIFWLKLLPTGSVKLGTDPIRVIVEGQLNLAAFHKLLETKMAYIADHMTILKIVGSAEANRNVDQIFEYFKNNEEVLALKCSTTNNKIITNLLDGIAKNKTNFSDSAQMAEFLRKTNSKIKIQHQKESEVCEALEHCKKIEDDKRLNMETEEQEVLHKDEAAELEAAKLEIERQEEAQREKIEDDERKMEIEIQHQKEEDLEREQEALRKKEAEKQEEERRKKIEEDERLNREMEKERKAREELEREQEALRKKEAAKQEAAKQEAAKLEEAKQEVEELEEAGRKEIEDDERKVEALCKKIEEREASEELEREQEAFRKIEAAKQEAAKQEAAKQEAAKQEAAKQEAAKQEAAKQEAAKQEAENLEVEQLEEAGRKEIEDDERKMEIEIQRQKEREELEREQEVLRKKEAEKQEEAREELEREQETARKKEAAKQEEARRQKIEDDERRKMEMEKEREAREEMEREQEALRKKEVERKEAAHRKKIEDDERRKMEMEIQRQKEREAREDLEREQEALRKKESAKQEVERQEEARRKKIEEDERHKMEIEIQRQKERKAREELEREQEALRKKEVERQEELRRLKKMEDDKRKMEIEIEQRVKREEDSRIKRLEGERVQQEDLERTRREIEERVEYQKQDVDVPTDASKSRTYSDPNPLQTVFILDESGTEKGRRFTEKIIPMMLSTIFHGNPQLVHLVTFVRHKTTVGQMFQLLEQTLHAKKRIRCFVLTDREVHEHLSENLIKFLSELNYSFELEVVRLTSKNAASKKYKLIEIDAGESNEFIAKRIAECACDKRLNELHRQSYVVENGVVGSVYCSVYFIIFVIIFAILFIRYINTFII